MPHGPPTVGVERAYAVDVLVENNFELAHSAAALPVHRNTLRDRIHRISDAIGVDIDSTYGRGLAWIHPRGPRA